MLNVIDLLKEVKLNYFENQPEELQEVGSTEDLNVTGIKQPDHIDIARWCGYDVNEDNQQYLIVVSITDISGTFESGDVLVDIRDGLGDYSIR